MKPLALGLALLAAPLFAGAAAAAEGGVAQPLNEVALPPLLAPMIVEGRLQGYAHLTISVRPGGPDKLLSVREKVPFLQDAFLRELNRGSITKPDDAAAVDVAATTRRLLGVAKQVLPGTSVVAVKITNLAYVPLVQD